MPRAYFGAEKDGECVILRGQMMNSACCEAATGILTSLGVYQNVILKSVYLGSGGIFTAFVSRM